MRLIQWALLVSIVACSNAPKSRFGDGGAADGGATTSNDSGPVLVGDDSGVKNGSRCSSDLRSVVDAQGAVIETCDDDKGCADAKCVPACDAASASKGNIGCSFVVSTPSFMSIIKPPCHAAFLANAWPRDAQLTVTRAGTTYDVTKFGRIASSGAVGTWKPVPSTGIPPGQVAVLFLSHDPASANGGSLACPVSPAMNSTAAYFTGASAATGRTSAFTITSDMPVSTYDILPFGGATSMLPSAQLVLPTSAWGTNFVAALAPASNRSTGFGQDHWLQVIAATDNTEVSIVPNTTLPMGVGVPSGPVNTLSKYTLNAGEFIQWQNTGDLSGSLINATQPIAVMGGQTYLCWNTPTSLSGGCDSAHQLVPPVAALGSEYAVAPPRSRTVADESMTYRIVGTVDGTDLTFDPPIAAAPKSVTSGGVSTFDARGGFTVTSQDNSHPFLIAQIMGGSSVSSTSLGDEEYVNVLPPAQFLSKYVFFSDPSYPDTRLAIVRVKGNNGFADVEIACSGKVSGWKAMGSGGKYEMASVQLVEASVGVAGCSNGPQSAKSDAPFGVVVWGMARDSSYAYPAGGNAAGINEVVVPVVPH